MVRGNAAGTGRLDRIVSTLVAALAAVVMVVAIAAQARADEAPAADPDKVVETLRKGGYVIYIRHGLTEQNGPMDGAADAPCDTQRNLSAAGRAQAAQIGKSMKALAIPIGRVVASPFCRTRETAEIAFGRYEVDQDLLFVIESSADEAKRRAEALHRLLATPPKRGTNSVLVSHSANLREAAGIFAKPEGAAYVFRPLPGGRFEAVAKLLPEDWARVAERKRARTR
jgi:broad specificity phosphatase PhoE